MAAAHLKAPAVIVPPVPGCTGKKRYTTRAAADAVAKRWGYKFNPYLCHHCKTWHCTSVGLIAVK